MNKNCIELHGPFIFILFLTVIVFYAGITPSFSSDDYIHLLNNTKFNGLKEALIVFTEPYGREYRPMVRLSLWLNYLMGNSAIPFKITNLFLHLISTYFVYRLLSKLQFSKLAGLLGTAIFALHPIHVTSIHFILGRTDLVAAVFYFGTLVLAAEWKDTISIRRYLAVIVTFMAALASKEMSVTLCLMMFFFVFHNQNVKDANTFVNVLIKLAPFFVITLAYTFIRIFMWSKLENDVTVYTDYSLLRILTNYLTWFFALIYPFDLYRAQEFMVENPLGFLAVFVFSVIFVLGVLVKYYGRKLFEIYKHYWLWVGLIWICVTLLPICGGNPHRWYLYIPSFGLSILIAALVEVTYQKKQKIFLIFLGLLLLIYSIEDVRLSTIWSKQSDLTADFLKQVDAEKIYNKERIYFANIPFGYKSSYLFTFNSLQEAIEYNFGRSPEIVPISYVNVDDDIQISSSLYNGNINFKITPNHYNFFLLSANERRFDHLEVKNKQGALVKINVIAKNRKIADYTITIHEGSESNFYYFDGKKIKSGNDIGP